MSYYTLACHQKVLNRIAQLSCDFANPDDYDLDWLSGRMFDHEPEQPLRLRAKGRPGTMLPVLRQTPVPLMSSALASALMRAGVSNLITYTTEILDPAGALISSDFLAFNVIGMLGGDATDKGPRLSTARLDAAGAGKELLFRVTDAPYALVASETLRTRLGAEKLPGLCFTAAVEWSIR